MRHADALERRRDAITTFAGGHVAIGERQFDVLEYRQVSNQVESLKNETNLPIPNACPLDRCQSRDRLAVKVVLTTSWCVEQTKNREQRRLAAARRAGDGDVLALPDFEVDVLQRVRLDFIGQEHFRDPRHVNQRLGVRRHCLLPEKVCAENRDVVESPAT